MSMTAEHPPTRTLVASIPGGPARQYRVQHLPEGESQWQKFRLFAKRESAERCARDLRDCGITARVVAIRICPTAA